MTMLMPNQSPEPTAVGAVCSAIAVHAASRRWLFSFGGNRGQRRVMRSLFIGLCVGVLVAAGAFQARGEEHRLLLYHTDMDRGGGTNQWWLPLSRLERLPKWRPEKEDEPPLSLMNAVKIAGKWIVSKGVGGGDVEEVVLRPVHPDEALYSYHFYYRISFGVAPYGNHLTCIVLMDGAVLEPTLYGKAE